MGERMSSDVTTYFDRLRLHLGDAYDADVLRELASHVEDRVDALVSRGMPPDRARRSAIDALGRPRTLAHLLRQARLITPWRDALAGASAFALLALIVGMELWSAPLVAIAASAVVIGIAVYGLWLGRPTWFYPWAGVALSLPLVVGYLAFSLLHREAGVMLDGGATPLALAGIAGALLYFPVGAFVVAAAVLVAVR